MPASTVTIEAINLMFTDIAEVVVTTVQQDPDVGDYVRDIRIFGSAFIGDEKVMIAQIKLRAVDADKIDLIAPQQRF
jgi:hypothetical protein